MGYHNVFVGLGSNLNDPEGQIKLACDALRQLANDQTIQVSSLYHSVAVGPPQPDYLNAVAHFATSLDPLALLDALQAIEAAQGRVRSLHWGPRTLDLDILLIDDLQLDHSRLQVPHPFLRQRNFVLVPLLELAPELRLPGSDKVADLVQQIGETGLTRLSSP
ncbi:MAG: 2-amino-4-hydroxy-6-hydroxymethyldihydropteridine diphosphokinase [Cellvibrionaceae bacterium]|nr:2-amino-4-hydroxy-6-hydroxymethyldihydropteridine diphosphokinase [Cellvibrionaceae bacterium]